MFVESHIAGIPAGAMVTALMKKVGGDGDILWFHSDESFNHFLATNESQKLPGIKLPGVSGTTNLQEALRGKNVVFLALRSWDLRTTLQLAVPYIDPDALIITGSKGFDEYEDKYYTPSQVIEQLIPGSRERVAVISGPNFAKQIALGKITGATVAAYKKETSLRVRELFNHRDKKDFLVYLYKGNPEDIEVVGAFKNVVGLVMGFARSLDNYDENTGALILQRGLYESSLLCRAMRCDPKVVMEACGVGDYGLLMNSMSSRNVKAGYNFGIGIWSIDDLMNPERTIEGVRTVKAVKELAGKRIALMHLSAYAYKVIYEGMNPKDAVENLLLGKIPVL